mmetsp:Transcript_130735/g.254784  ORF Transcript_130735/g.254784 Transcript_130735/m.254784 type:complete len:175 (+) Transcript_130735:48-572(+)
MRSLQRRRQSNPPGWPRFDSTQGATAVQVRGLHLSSTPSCTAEVPRRSKEPPASRNRAPAVEPRHAVRTGLLEGPGSDGDVRARADCAPVTDLNDKRVVVVSFRTAPGGPISDARLGSWQLRTQLPGQLEICRLLSSGGAPRIARPAKLVFAVAIGVGDKTSKLLPGVSKMWSR